MSDAQLTWIFWSVMVLCAGLLGLSIYKVRAWYKKPENIARIQNAIKDRPARPRLLTKTVRTRNYFALIWFGICILFLIVAGVAGIPRHTSGYILIGFIILMPLVGSLITNYMWRCPACRGSLPGIAGRSGKRPKSTDTCPHCGYTLEK